MIIILKDVISVVTFLMNLLMLGWLTGYNDTFPPPIYILIVDKNWIITNTNIDFYNFFFNVIGGNRYL